MKTKEVEVHRSFSKDCHLFHLESCLSFQDVCDNPEIIALQIALAECQEKLKRLTWVEKRLECLEATAKGKVMVDEKTWNNLVSRVTLLETELLLSKKVVSV